MFKFIKMTDIENEQIVSNSVSDILQFYNPNYNRLSTQLFVKKLRNM